MLAAGGTELPRHVAFLQATLCWAHSPGRAGVGMGGAGKMPAGAAGVVFSSVLLTSPTWARPLALDQKCPGPKCCQGRVCGRGKAPRPHPMSTFSPASWLLARAPSHRSLPCSEEAVYPCRPPRDERTVPCSGPRVPGRCHGVAAPASFPPVSGQRTWSVPRRWQL